MVMIDGDGDRGDRGDRGDGSGDCDGQMGGGDGDGDDEDATCVIHPQH